jgi:hypothetical protein
VRQTRVPRIVTVVALGAAIGAGGALAAAIVGGSDQSAAPSPKTPPPIVHVPDEQSVGVDASGALKLPPLTDKTRPVIVGRDVMMADVVRQQVAAKDAAIEACMAAHGAPKIDVSAEYGPGTVGFDDPDGSAQKACAHVHGRGDALVMSTELRIAAMAAYALRTRIASCSQHLGQPDPSQLPAPAFGACVKQGFDAIELPPRGSP